MRVAVLGSAAGGGFPQWNCNARLSRAARAGLPGFRRRTQSSITVSANGAEWALFNASPDIREQIAAFPALSPAPDAQLRSTPIACVVLTNADVDHIAGLLSLRESERFVLYATRRVSEVLEANPIFRVLNPAYVERRLLNLNETVALEGPSGPIGVMIETFAVPGKVALFMENDAASDRNFGTEDGDTIGLRITAAANPDESLFYIPGCAAMTDRLRARLSGSRCLLFDGTVFTDNEMQEAGVGTKTGSRMGHMHMAGPAGSIAALRSVDIQRRIFVHINNTNPVLEEGSAAERSVLESGWEIGFDGMEITL
ncbi:MAG: pyrroloquinoline quinone biosynthesis protein PqqB [Rhizobiales bacterium]|nr:pyrroloquinoline quinone biosynthesis protein PqqB [Hyphomicrobiales bacterium]